jgi:hypothetical protein
MEWNVMLNVVVWYGVYVFFFLVFFCFCPLCFLHSPGHLRKKERKKQQNNKKQKSEKTAKNKQPHINVPVLLFNFLFCFFKTDCSNSGLFVFALVFVF